MAQLAVADISRTLIAALEYDSRVNLRHNRIRVAVQREWVRLEGTVDSIIAKKVAVTTAQHVAGAMPVVDCLRVAVTEPQEDGALRVKVSHALSEEPAFMEYGIRTRHNGSFTRLREIRDAMEGNLDVTAQEGVVTLEGRVGSLSHRRLAEVLVWWTPGCQDVDNRLHVTPPEQENEGELVDAVRIVLEKDPLVHASQLHVSAKGNTVTLEGYVASREEQRLAVLDTWYIPGVRDVDDRIEARV